MRKSKVLAKIRTGQLARVCSAGHLLPFYIRYAAHYNYDGIWLDLEHRTMDYREVQAFLSACLYNDIDCMVRTQTTGRSHLYHYLEDGATGLMIPFVSTTTTAQQIIDAAKFPPLGNRGVDGAGIDNDYYVGTAKKNADYYEDANRETFIVAQIETLEAFANLEAIASIKGIDCLFVGPADMGLRLKTCLSTLTINDVNERVAAVAKQHGLAWGTTAGSVEDLVRHRKLGAQIIPWGSDFDLRKALQNCGADLARVASET